MSFRMVPSIAIATVLTTVFLAAQHATHDGASPAQMTDQQKIQNAMSAAPADIARAATIMDHPSKTGDKPRQLRAGTNGWVCFPTTPPTAGSSGEDPMCLDREWQKWVDALMTKSKPSITGTGIAYMLAGDKGASNTDPFATGPTPTNQWVTTPAHIMVLFSDAKALDAYPTDPKNGGPFVMFKGTPYAHLMVPVSQKQAVIMK
jgi:hypothetical protein